MVTKTMARHVLQTDIYDFEIYPYSSGQKFYTENGIYYEDVDGERLASLNIRSIQDVQTLSYSPSIWQIDTSTFSGSTNAIALTYPSDNTPSLMVNGAVVKSSSFSFDGSIITLTWTPTVGTSYEIGYYPSVVMENLKGHFLILHYDDAEDYCRFYVRPEDGVLIELRAKVSAGVVQMPAYTFDSSTFSMASSYINLYTTDNFQGPVHRYFFEGKTFSLASFTTALTNYIVADFNNGAPLIKITTTLTEITSSDVVPIFTVERTGNDLHILPWGPWGVGLADKLNRRLIKTERFKRQDGLVLNAIEVGTSNTYNISIDAGNVWYGDTLLDSDSLTLLNSATSPIWLYYHSSSTAWTYRTTDTIIPKGASYYYYDSTSAAPGYGLQEVQNTTKYTVLWVFRGMGEDERIYGVLSNASDYSLLQAQASGLPSNLPTILLTQALLVGRVIISGNGSDYYVESAFSTSFYGASIINHNDLSGRSSTDAHPISAITGLQEIFDITREPTGFYDCSHMIATYNGTIAKTVTLTFDNGSTTVFNAYFSGVKIPGLSSTTSWTSSSYSETGVFPKYLRSVNGETPSWSTTPWSLDNLQIAMIQKTAAGQYFILRETHGFMPWQAHEEFHQRFGTYKLSGGSLEGSYSTTPTTRYARVVDTTTIEDEDLESNLAAMSTPPSYTQMFLSSTNTMNWVTAQTEMVGMSGAYPYYNLKSPTSPYNWSSSTVSNGEYTSVWLLAFNVGDDVISQPYRYGWLMGQSKGSLSSQENAVPADLDLGSIRGVLPEFCFLAKIVIKVTGSKWQIEQVYYLDGDKTTQIISPGGIPYHTHDIADVIDLQTTLDNKINSSTTSSQTISGPLQIGTGTVAWEIDASDGSFKIQQGSSTTIFTIYATDSGGTPAYKIKIEGKTEITDLDFGGW